MQKKITSIHNPSVKALVQLQEKSRERKKTGLFIIEGLREVQLAQSAGYLFDQIWWCPEIFGDLDKINNLDSAGNLLVEVSAEVYKKVAYRGSSQGIIAFAKAKQHDLNGLQLPENPLLLVAQAPRKTRQHRCIIKNRRCRRC